MVIGEGCYDDGEDGPGGDSDITETGYLDSDIIFGLEYCYTIKAFDGAYESDPSNISK